MTSCQFSNSSQACRMVIFGVSGDLSARRLMPALFSLHCQNLLPEGFSCWGCSRREWSKENFLDFILHSLQTFTEAALHEKLKTHWESFSQKLHYQQCRFDHEADYRALQKVLANHKAGCENTLFYLSTPSSYFTTICQQLSRAGLLQHQKPPAPWNRIILEKPFGHDLSSAIELQKELLQQVDETQIFRIDHWLGKETVQNLMVWRFSNHIFESLWNRTHIDHVQISVSEDLGIGRRGSFFEEAGILRDMIQNHMLQLLSLVAMEPPITLKPDDVRYEKLKVLEAIRPINYDQVPFLAVRGQYDEGRILDQNVCAYREEAGVAKNSNIETYAAVKLNIDNWRWYGVPFYLRVGKRLKTRCTEVAIVFKKEPAVLFKQAHGTSSQNILLLRIQPNEGISLVMNCKQPNLAKMIRPVSMDFDFESTFGQKGPQAYERLLCDSLAGDNTLFAHGDEVLESWKIVQPILDYWKDHNDINFPNYRAGSWGPQDADDLLAKDQRFWINPDCSTRGCL